MTSKIEGLADVEEYQEFAFPCLKVSQPIGEFFVASMPSKLLGEVTWFDVRRIMAEEREFESYLGIQRPVEKRRVEDLKKYVLTEDATFPTSIIIAVPGDCAKYDEGTHTMTFCNKVDVIEGEEPVYVRNIAKVLDGQHRIEGLREAGQPLFDLNVSIFVDIDVATQAQIFSTVNLEQTKVNKSLVYDLFALATHRSPQKTCHNIAVALNQNPSSPFFERIKRLGRSTPNRTNETLTQATFVEALLPYVSDDAKRDRNIYLKGRVPPRLLDQKLEKVIFGNMFIDEKDVEITDVLWNYFAAVRERWPDAWGSNTPGLMLNRTNGFRALMRYLRPCYLSLASPGGVPALEDFLGALKNIALSSDDFTVENFKPGTAGESLLYRSLTAKGLRT